MVLADFYFGQQPQMCEYEGGKSGDDKGRAGKRRRRESTCKRVKTGSVEGRFPSDMSRQVRWELSGPGNFKISGGRNAHVVRYK